MLLDTLTHKSLLTLTWTPSHTCSGVFSQHAAADIHLVCTHIFAVTSPGLHTLAHSFSVSPHLCLSFSPLETPLGRAHPQPACALPPVSLKTNAVFPLALPALCRCLSVLCLVPYGHPQRTQHPRTFILSNTPFTVLRTPLLLTMSIPARVSKLVFALAACFRK